MRRWLLAASLLVSGLAGAAAPARMIKLGGPPGDPRTQAHVAFARDAGFDGLWVYADEAGRWTKDGAPRRPKLDRDFVRLARASAERGETVWVSINPVADMRGRFVFTDERHERAIVAFAELLRKRAGIRHLVLSFDDQPTDLAELADIFRYGRVAAPAHLDLARRLAARLPPDVELWLCAAAYCDAHLGDGTKPYAKAFLEGLPSLPPSIGIVWTGPQVVSPSITRADLAATRARLGGRRLLLYDNFPVEGGEADALALVLGALRGRDAAIGEEIAAYLACPMPALGGSRLSLMTVAEFLRDPKAYDPDAAAARAVARLAGGDREAREALKTQQVEWGGWVGGRNYWTSETMSAQAAARRLGDPAYVESFTWTAARYAGRMAALERLADAPFRDDLLRVMARKLAVARAMPLTIEYLARVRAGRADAAEVLARIDDERRSWAGAPDTSRVLGLFLATAGVPPPKTR